MFSRTVKNVSTPICVQSRNMATLQEISLRLKSVSNIQKITKSMKMVSAAKYARAERDLKPARPYGLGAKAFFESAGLDDGEEKKKHLVIAMTSDRGLCGAVHSNIVRMIRTRMAECPAGVETKMIIIGDKAKSMLQKQFGKNILMQFADIGKKPPTFQDAGKIAQAILEEEYEFDLGDLYFNIFKSVVAYTTTTMPIYSLEAVKKGKNTLAYDSVDQEVIRSYNEFALTSVIYYALKESACSEQSARMTAMDSASKNAGEMIDKLTLTYNRTRQAVITNELVEIISGAAAV